MFLLLLHSLTCYYNLPPQPPPPFSSSSLSSASSFAHRNVPNNTLLLNVLFKKQIPIPIIITIGVTLNWISRQIQCNTITIHSLLTIIIIINIIIILLHLVFIVKLFLTSLQHHLFTLYFKFCCSLQNLSTNSNCFHWSIGLILIIIFQSSRFSHLHLLPSLLVSSFICILLFHFKSSIVKYLSRLILLLTMFETKNTLNSKYQS